MLVCYSFFFLTYYCYCYDREDDRWLKFWSPSASHSTTQQGRPVSVLSVGYPPQPQRGLSAHERSCRKVGGSPGTKCLSGRDTKCQRTVQASGGWRACRAKHTMGRRGPKRKTGLFLHTQLGRRGGGRSENNRGEAFQNLWEDRSLFEAKLHDRCPQSTVQTVEREDWGPEHPVHGIVHQWTSSWSLVCLPVQRLGTGPWQSTRLSCWTLWVRSPTS